MSIVLEKPVELGEGITLQPPAGWTQTGWVTDNPLWLEPKDRMDWVPPGASTVVLHWELSSTPLPAEVMTQFVQLLKGQSEPLSIQQILPFYPTLVRMSMDSISRAQVLHFPDAESILCVQYAIERTQEYGVVFYGLTNNSALGEYQMLAYEGKTPEYGQFFEGGKAALNSFRTHQRADFSQKRAVVNEALAEPVKRSKFGALKPKEPAPEPTPTVTEQPRETTLAEKYSQKYLPPKQKTETRPVVETEIVRKKKATEEIRKILDAQKSEAPKSSQSLNAQTQSMPELPASSQATDRKPRRRTAELRSLKVMTHILQPGETIKGLITMYWPGIDEREAEARLKEIYTLNRIHKNICWSQKPGQIVMLPGD